MYRTTQHIKFKLKEKENPRKLSNCVLLVYMVKPICARIIGLESASAHTVINNNKKPRSTQV